MPKPMKQSHPLAILAGIAGAVVGWLLGEYCGAKLWIPGGALILFALLFAKTPIQPAFFPGAIAVAAAQVTSLIVLSVVSGSWSVAAIDMLALAAGIIWLWWWPGLAAALFLGAVEMVSLALGVYALSTVPPGSAEHRALTGHCSFRVAALFCLVVGYVRMRRELSTSTPVTIPAASDPSASEPKA
jgi:hypothetical protein